MNTWRLYLLVVCCVIIGPDHFERILHTVNPE